MSEQPQQKSSRITTFDLMRGYFLIAIAINHLNYSLGAAGLLTMRGELFVSSAEGFFLLSGLILGLVRGAKLVQKPFKFVATLLLQRSAQLYATYVVATLLFTFIGWLFIDAAGLKPGIMAAGTSIWDVIWQTLTFQYLYGWVDYLRLYIIFILCSPIVMWLLRKGKWWIVLATSLAVWLFAPQPDWPTSVYTQPQNWQVIFFGGMIIGYHWKQLAAFWTSRSKMVRVTTVSVLATVAVTTLALNIFLAFGGKISPEIYNTVGPLRESLRQPYFDKENMPWVRLLLFLVWFWATFALFRRFETQLTKWLGWLLLPLGTNSLYTYVVSGFIIFFVHLYIPSGGRVFNTIVLIGMIAVVWLMIRYKILMKIIPR